MKDLTFEGIDKDLETSLFEYNVIASKEEHEDGSGTHLVVYKINDDNYGTGHISEKQLNGYVLGDEFPDAKDIRGFLRWSDSIKEDWLKQSFIQKLYDLISYWGYENIMGVDYSPVNKEFVINNYLK